MICKSVPPVFCTVKLLVTVPPELIVPKSVDRGVITMLGAVPAEPVNDTVALPPLLLMTKLLMKVPVASGANVTVAVVCAPAASVVPFAGTPVTEYGAAGAVEVPNVNGWLPVFWIEIERAFVVFTVMAPKLTVGGVTLSCAAAT